MPLDRHRQCGWCHQPIALTPYRTTQVWTHTPTGSPVCSDGTRHNCNTLAPSDPTRAVVYFADARLDDQERHTLLAAITEAVENARAWHHSAHRHDQLHLQTETAGVNQREIANDYRRSAERETGRATGLLQCYAQVHDSRDAHHLTRRLARIAQEDGDLADIIGDLDQEMP